MLEAARGVGRDLSLLDHAAVFIDDSDREFGASNINRSDHSLSLSERALSQVAIKAFIKTNQYWHYLHSVSSGISDTDCQPRPNALRRATLSDLPVAPRVTQA